MKKFYWVYILTTKKNSVFYVGVTNNLERRVFEHKNSVNKGFTHRYNVKKAVYFELFEDINAAIHREKQLKKWRRAWKFELIQKFNPEMKDIFDNDGIIIEEKVYDGLMGRGCDY